MNHPQLLPDQPFMAQPTCPLPGCDEPLFIVITSDAPVYCSDTAEQLADPANAITSSWEIRCQASHVVMLPHDSGDDSYTFGQHDCDGECDDPAWCPRSDHERLRTLVANQPVVEP